MEQDYSYLNKSVTDMIAKIEAVGSTFDASLQPVYFMAGVLILIMACIKIIQSRDMTGAVEFIVKYAQLMVVILLSSQWMPLTEGYVSQMGQWGAGAAGFDVRELAPGTVIVKALSVAWRMYSENMSWMRLIFGSANDTVAHLLLLIGCLGTILLAVLMAAMIMLFFVVFKFASVIALAFLVFMLFGPTRFMAAPGIARILAYGVQMLVLSVTVGLFFMILEGLDLSGHLHVGQSLSILVVFFFFALLFKHSVAIAREQISGMPNLDLHDVGRIGGAAGSALLGAASGVAIGALGTMGGLKLGGIGRGGGAPGLSGGGSAAGGGGQAPISAPRAAMRMMLDAPPIDAQWTEARDLPKSASRLIEATKQLPPPPPRQLPPPSR